VARATIKDIARISGYSKTTVSFAFNDPSRIGKETHRKIIHIAEELGYIPDPVARNLTLRRHGTIGLLLPEVISYAFYNPYMSQIVQGIGEVCERVNHSLTLIPPISESLMEGIRRAAVDGLITMGLEPGMEAVEFINRRHLPFVAIDGRVGGGFPVVGIDDRTAARTAMDHVLQLGHRRLAIVAFGAEPRISTSSHVKMERLAGYREALDACDPGIAGSVSYYYSAPSIADGRRIAGEILSAPDRPTAIVAMSDILALGILDHLTAPGHRRSRRNDRRRFRRHPRVESDPTAADHGVSTRTGQRSTRCGLPDESDRRDRRTGPRRSPGGACGGGALPVRPTAPRRYDSFRRRSPRCQRPR
jgi:DNA-binding LacI/PurR family transcriptional regulator